MSKHLQEAIRRKKTRLLRLTYWKPYDHTQPFGPGNVGAYDWQIDFHNASGEYRERCIMGGNRVGKTQTPGAEVSMHMTGEYPPWFTGRRFETANHGWICGESWEQVRDVLAVSLLGETKNEIGTGWLPKDKIIDVTYRQAGVTEVPDQIKVRHKNGGISTAQFKTYEQGRKKHQGKKLHWCWDDEQVPMDIYTEHLTRLLDYNGLEMLSFTPLEGVTEVVQHFMGTLDEESQDKAHVYMKNVSWDDAPHLGEQEKNELWSSYRVHERETRKSGAPMLGTGAIFPIEDEAIMCEPFDIPDWYKRINGIDPGLDHPAGGSWCALDPETDTFYVYDCYKQSGQGDLYHANAMKKHGSWIPTAWPHDAQRRKPDGDDSWTTTRQVFKRHGLFMLSDPAHYPDPDKGNRREPGLKEMMDYMRLDRFKVFRPLSQWFQEKRLYHRKDGVIIDRNDDIMSATRMAFVMRRYARTRPMTTVKKVRRTPLIGPARWKSGIERPHSS